MNAIFDLLGPWTWLILAVLFLGLEISAPGAVFLWFAFAAAGVGVLSFLIDWTWQAQGIAFVGLSVIFTTIGRHFARRKSQSEIDDDTPMLNQRGRSLIGREFTLGEPIRNGTGRVRVDDSFWRVKGPDLDVGQKVVVVDADAALLEVEAKSD